MGQVMEAGDKMIISPTVAGCAKRADCAPNGDQALSFHSILVPGGMFGEQGKQPESFEDLNLDQLVEAICEPKKEYDLKPYYYTPLGDERQIRYRQEIFRDLEKPLVMDNIVSFGEKMSRVKRHMRMLEKLQYEDQKRGWFLESALTYCEAVEKLQEGLSQVELISTGLRRFREYLRQYVNSPGFGVLLKEARSVRQALAGLRYSIIIHPGRFIVKAYQAEPDYTREIEETFEKFRQGVVKQYVPPPRDGGGMNHVEAKILEFVARLFPEPFSRLERFCKQHYDFMDEVIERFDREVQFYLAYLNFVEDFKRGGLPFSYPQVSTRSKEEQVIEGFDLALARVLRKEQRPVVCNDYYLAGAERVMVVTGPNQGGKTTFARMFGQLHYLAALGCPVPARKAVLFLCDRIFTHFQREERVEDLRGRLQDDLVRMRELLSRAGPDSLLVLNEVFSSTTLHDALFLGRSIMKKITELDCLCVWVTFLEQLSCMGEKIVSMTGTVDPEDPSIRTFKILRKPADGLAYALSIARKHGLTYQQIKDRISK
ncbi:MAG: DNA mismatch repair protein MutS [bacterium]